MDKMLLAKNPARIIFAIILITEKNTEIKNICKTLAIR